MLPATENAQQLPHEPWFFTGVTAPSSTQFFSFGKSFTVLFVAATSVIIVRKSCEVKV